MWILQVSPFFLVEKGSNIFKGVIWPSTMESKDHLESIGSGFAVRQDHVEVDEDFCLRWHGRKFYHGCGQISCWKREGVPLTAYRKVSSNSHNSLVHRVMKREEPKFPSHWIHVWYIQLHILLIFMMNVGESTIHGSYEHVSLSPSRSRRPPVFWRSRNPIKLHLLLLVVWIFLTYIPL